MGLTTLLSVPFSRYFHPGEPLAAYAAGDARLAQRLGGWDQLLARAGQWPAAAPRPETVAALIAFNQQMGADSAALGQLRLLSDPRTVVVATGQQAGILTGPLYALLKGLTAAKTAQWITAETGRPAVAVFWCLDDDHDYAEVNHLAVPAAAGLHHLRLPSAPPSGSAAGRYQPGPAASALIDELLALHQGRREVQPVADLLRATWREGQTLLEWFAACLLRLTRGTGLAAAALSLPPVRAALAPLAAAAVRAGTDITALANAAGEELAGEGYRQQVRKAAAAFPFFFMSDSGIRVPLRRSGGRIAAGDRTLAEPELLAEINQRPAAFSPGVLLNPPAFAQALPTVAYVGGPGEAAYHAQLPPVFRLLDLPQPTFIPRASVTLLNPLCRRLLERFNLRPEQALEFDPVPAAAQRQARDAGLPSDEAWAGLTADCLRPLADLDPLAAALDPALAAALAKTREKIADHVAALRQRMSSAAARRGQDIERDAARLGAWLKPDGGPQERTLSPFAFLFDEGPGLVSDLFQIIPPVPLEHALLSL